MNFAERLGLSVPGIGYSVEPGEIIAWGSGYQSVEWICRSIRASRYTV